MTSVANTTTIRPAPSYPGVSHAVSPWLITTYYRSHIRILSVQTAVRDSLSVLQNMWWYTHDLSHDNMGIRKWWWYESWTVISTTNGVAITLQHKLIDKQWTGIHGIERTLLQLHGKVATLSGTGFELNCYRRKQCLSNVNPTQGQAMQVIWTCATAGWSPRRGATSTGFDHGLDIQYSKNVKYTSYLPFVVVLM